MYPGFSTGFRGVGARELPISIVDADTAVEIGTATLNFAPGSRYLVVAHDDQAGDAVFSQIELPKFPYASETESLLSFAHLAEGVGAPVIAADPALESVLFEGVAYGEHSTPLPIGIADLFAYVDVSGDGSADVRAFLPLDLAGVFPGETIVAIAHYDADGALAIAVHDSWEIPSLPGEILTFAFQAPILPIPPAIDEVGAGVLHLVPGAGAARVFAADSLVNFYGTTEVAFQEGMGFARLPAGETDIEVFVDPLEAPFALTTPALVAGDRALAIAHLDANGEATFSFVNPDVSEIGAGNVRVHVLHLNPDVPAIDVGVGRDGDPAIVDLAFGEVSDGLDVPLDDYMFFIGETGDAYSLSVAASLTSFVPAGSVVVIVAYKGSEGELVVGAAVIQADVDVANYPDALNALTFEESLDVTLGLPPVFSCEGGSCVANLVFDPPVAIPDNDPTGVTRFFEFQEPSNCAVESATAEWSVTHTYPNDLRFDFTMPNGTTVASTGTGGAPGFIPSQARTDPGVTTTGSATRTGAPWEGVDPAGEWSVRIIDRFPEDVGVVNSLRLTLTCQP